MQFVGVVPLPFLQDAPQIEARPCQELSSRLVSATSFPGPLSLPAKNRAHHPPGYRWGHAVRGVNQPHLICDLEHLAVAKPKTAPGAALSATGYDGRGTATFEAAVFRNLMRLQTAAIAAQSRYQFFLTAGVNLKKLGDLFDGLSGTDRTLARINFAGDQFFRKRQATGLSTGAAVRPRKKFVSYLDPGIFLHLQKALRDREDRSEEQSDPNHDGWC